MKLEDVLVNILERLEAIDDRIDALLGVDEYPSVTVEVSDLEAQSPVDCSDELCATLEVDFGGWYT